MKPLEQVFAEKIDKRADGHWVWTAAKSKSGVGILWRHTENGPKRMTANQASWILFRGEIPPKTMVCRSCDQISCVNPDHLYLCDYSFAPHVEN